MAILAAPMIYTEIDVTNPFYSGTSCSNCAYFYVRTGCQVSYFFLFSENLQQHTKVRWLSIGPAIRRVLEQWDTTCQFIKDLEKDNTRKPKSINFKRAAALLATGEQNVTRVMLEFLKSTVPVFEEFPTVLQTSGPTLHVV